MARKALSFEESIQRLDAIVRQLESGNATLDESLKLFEEGTSLVGKCSAMLTQAEQKITKLMGNDNGTAVEVTINEEELSD